MRSPLTSVNMCIPFLNFPSPGPSILYMRDQDPIFMLSKLTGSLRRIFVDGKYTAGGGIRIYPLVEELQMALYSEGMPHLATYLLCFPNLRRLRCGFQRTTWIRYRHTADTLIEECRMCGTIQDWHDLNKRETTRKTLAWTILESFRGTIIDAYVLALPCRVERLHLLSTGGKRSAEYTMLSSILSDTQPSSLRLCLKIYEGRGYIPIVPPQLSDSWAQALRVLEIRINIVKHIFDLEECINHVTEMLRPMSVVSFRLELRCANMSMQTHENQQDESETYTRLRCLAPSRMRRTFCYTRDMLLQKDLHQCVRDIVRATPTLRRVMLMWARCYEYVPQQVVGIDFDNLPHSIDRPGDESDGWDKVGVDW
ncbi:hypothetical protein L227DRAFT_426939 [Lentinus tigrinus ALCF2SS1-6]|uniref:F-box domain-containing protein n=2 Tax=Lentinus tigrinus TaxID=5365 RepID=A0A5C2RRT6_9APHY|nr:hypothetical protein L227DRAFT_426939 [Lentinus tigrinus ALCF2SS1-6]